ncbi:MAG: STAS/SEC14 domain-containing protein [Deltaproteobacteria bacterium]|nr:STAS/SEC14 domain-containing protein [Deltaproteobacteria bacterium]
MALAIEQPVVVRQGFVRARVAMACQARDARSLLMAIDQAMERHRVRRVLLDRSDDPAPSEEIAAIFQHWVESARLFERVAFVGLPTMERIGLNMRALSRKLEVRAFDSADEAIEWLTR